MIASRSEHPPAGTRLQPDGGGSSVRLTTMMAVLGDRSRAGAGCAGAGARPDRPIRTTSAEARHARTRVAFMRPSGRNKPKRTPAPGTLARRVCARALGWTLPRSRLQIPYAVVTGTQPRRMITLLACAGSAVGPG